MSRKRGQESGGGAAALVAIIALLIVLYILFLPPDVRKDILDDDTGGTGTTSSGDAVLVLLEESPGRLDYVAYDSYDHDISPIYLLRTAESTELKSWGAFHVKNGVFDKKSYATRFKVEDREHTDDLLLSFIVRESQGTLLIKLNDEEILSSEITSYNPPPIMISKDQLLDDNLLEFEVSSVGWRFWSTNEYLIENMKLVAKVTDVSRQESRNVFVIRDMEWFNLAAAHLRFMPHCTPTKVGQLEITLNDQVLYTGIPDCGITNIKEFSTGMLNRGENTLLFKTTHGSYLIDHIQVRSDLKDPDYPLYRFELNETVWEELEEDDDYEVELKLEFIGNTERKQGTVYVNGRAFSFSTTDPDWDRTITGHVEEDDNWIKVTPDRGVLDVRKLTVAITD